MGLGRIPGIYKTWIHCKEQVHKFEGAQFKKFSTEVEALNFISNTQSITVENINTKKRAFIDESSNIVNKIIKTQVASVATSSNSSNKITIFTDGSSLGNGGKNAKAGVGVFFGENDPRYSVLIILKH